MINNNKWFRIEGADRQEGAVEIYFYKEIGFGELEADKICSEQFCKELDTIPKDRKVILRMNSCGGSFLDGLAIAYKILDRGNVECMIDGNCASAASVIAMACEKVIASAGSRILIHNANVSVDGFGRAELKNLLTLLEDVDLQMAKIYVKKTGKSILEIRALMDKNERLTAQQALDLGLVDEIREFDAREPLIAARDQDERKDQVKMKDKQEGDTPGSSITMMEAKVKEEKLLNEVLKDQKESISAELKKRDAEIAALREEAENRRVSAIRDKVNHACDEGRITNQEIDSWVKVISKDEEAMKLLYKIPKEDHTPIKDMPTIQAESKLDNVKPIKNCDSKSISSFESYYNKLKATQN